MFDEFLITLLRVAELAVVVALPLWVRYVFSGMMRRHDKIGYFARPGTAK